MDSYKHPKIGVLLVNLGTPSSLNLRDVKKYLKEFLLDPRVIDLPLIFRHLLVRGWIIPRRVKNTHKSYKCIWQKEGSPLLVYGKRVQTLLQKELGNNFKVILSMRYQQPSIEEGLNQLKDVDHIIVLPLFPQYASATTGSIFEKVMSYLRSWTTIPTATLVSHYCLHPDLIKLIADKGKKHSLESYDHIIFSFHGLPEKELHKQNSKCLSVNSCCVDNNFICYKAQCLKMGHMVASELNISNYTISFQSRLGSGKWISPYTNEVVHTLAKENKKKLLVFCLSFVADCLETVYEIGIELQHEFVNLGGEKIDLVESLNSDPQWISFLKELIYDHVPKSLKALERE